MRLVGGITHLPHLLEAAEAVCCHHRVVVTGLSQVIIAFMSVPLLASLSYLPILEFHTRISSVHVTNKRLILHLCAWENHCKKVFITMYPDP